MKLIWSACTSPGGRRPQPSSSSRSCGISPRSPPSWSAQARDHVPGRGTAIPELAEVFRTEHGRAASVLTRLLGDIDLAEDPVQDPFATTVLPRSTDGVPPSPAGWIITTARNRAIDRLRRESARGVKEARATLLAVPDESRAEGPVEDDRLRLIFTCCHDAVSRTAHPARPISRTACRRSWRLYLIFNDGYTGSSGRFLAEYTGVTARRWPRDDRCAEALRLSRLLALLMPDEPEVQGLSTLLLLISTRR
jgi:RNA polymerase sigma-70 factor, ECF subfamily